MKREVLDGVPKTAVARRYDLQNKDIAERLSLPVQIVTKWRKRLYAQRLPGLNERPRTGRPSTKPATNGTAGT